MTATWPHPADRPVDRARRIACQLHSALKKHDPRLADSLANAAARMGEGWLVPIEQFETPGEVLTAADIASMIGVPAATIRSWMNRGMMTAYTVEEALRCQRELRRRRRCQSDGRMAS